MFTRLFRFHCTPPCTPLYSSVLNDLVLTFAIYSSAHAEIQVFMCHKYDKLFTFRCVEVEGGGRLKGVLNSLMLNVVIMILKRIEKNFTARRLSPNVNCVELEINNNVVSSDHQVAYPIYNGNSSEQRKYETYF